MAPLVAAIAEPVLAMTRVLTTSAGVLRAAAVDPARSPDNSTLLTGVFPSSSAKRSWRDDAWGKKTMLKGDVTEQGRRDVPVETAWTEFGGQAHHIHALEPLGVAGLHGDHQHLHRVGHNDLAETGTSTGGDAARERHLSVPVRQQGAEVVIHGQFDGLLGERERQGGAEAGVECAGTVAAGDLAEAVKEAGVAIGVLLEIGLRGVHRKNGELADDASCAAEDDILDQDFEAPVVVRRLVFLHSARSHHRWERHACHGRGEYHRVMR